MNNEPLCLIPVFIEQPYPQLWTSMAIADVLIKRGPCMRIFKKAVASAVTVGLFAFCAVAVSGGSGIAALLRRLT